MIIYTNLMPKRFSGYNLGLITLIRPRYRHDKGLHIHEAVHRAQFIRNPFMGLLYLCSKKYRFGYEVEAFRAQLKVAPDSVDVFANYLTKNYGLKVTLKEAVEALVTPEGTESKGV